MKNCQVESVIPNRWMKSHSAEAVVGAEMTEAAAMGCGQGKMSVGILEC